MIMTTDPGRVLSGLDSQGSDSSVGKRVASSNSKRLISKCNYVNAGARNVVGKRPTSMYHSAEINYIVLRCKRSVIIQHRLFASQAILPAIHSLYAYTVSLPTAEMPTE